MRTLPQRFRTTREEDREEMEDAILTYTRTRGGMMTHAIGKLTSSERQKLFLLRGRVWCNCIGGVAMDDRDLQKLVKRGLMKFVRVPYGRGWGGDYALRRTAAVITEKGKTTRLR